ncbi:MAG: hypothetical protein FWG63_02955 [Defluviitaleaceae bacterium]|nr:hypothetical protein [Defluviitaleaceae bacterium]
MCDKCFKSPHDNHYPNVVGRFAVIHNCEWGGCEIHEGDEYLENCNKALCMDCVDRYLTLGTAQEFLISTARDVLIGDGWQHVMS